MITNTYRLTSKVLLLSLLLSVVYLSTTITVWAAGALSQGFKTSDRVSVGNLVSLENTSNGSVQLATSDQSAQLIGVVGTKTLIALSSGKTQAEVVTSGTTPILVSDINGSIKTGDKITASPLKGIGMKALHSSEVVGTAQGDFSSASGESYSVTDKAGVTKQVHVGTIQSQINVTFYSVAADKLSPIVPSFLVNVGSSIAGKDISPTRVLISFFCLSMGFVLAGIMIQSGVRSGIISVGRNPLAHQILRRSLIDVLLTAMGVLIITAVAFYLALTL